MELDNTYNKFRWVRITGYYNSMGIDNMLEYFNKWLKSNKPYEPESVHFNHYAIIMGTLWQEPHDQYTAKIHPDRVFIDKTGTPGKLEYYVDGRELEIRIKRKAINANKRAKIFAHMDRFSTNLETSHMSGYTFFICLPTQSQ